MHFVAHSATFYDKLATGVLTLAPRRVEGVVPTLFRGGIGKALVHYGMLLATLAFASWWTSHTILDPGRSRRVVQAVLSDKQFRMLIADNVGPPIVTAVGLTSLPSEMRLPTMPGTNIPTASAIPGGNPLPPPSVPADQAALKIRLVAVLDDAGVRSRLEDFVFQTHQRLIGERNTPAVLDRPTVERIVTAAVPDITPDQLARIPPISIDVPGLKALTSAKKVFVGRFAWYALGAVVLLVAAMVLSSDKRATLKLIGRWLIGISAGHLFFLWLLPAVIIPRVSKSPWAGFTGAVARALSAGIIIGLVALIGLGVLCLFADRFIPAQVDAAGEA